ncbi:MAG: LysM peptidoglycan-binding domain-containing protein [Planctomycetes bacterium]|nr:LysM peptidoglycan-binding domain-containing protein [Planctomycetota bacterium]
MKLTTLILVATGLLALTACKKQDATARVEEPFVPLDQIETTSGSEGDPYAPRYTSDRFTDTPPPAETVEFQPAARTATATSDEPLTPSDDAHDDGLGRRVHVVRKGDTLYALARHYYADQAKWRQIWEANRGQLRDPDKLFVGMELVIP